MGKKAKTSRKGKKAWRANIQTDDIDEFFEQSTRDAHSGGSLTAVPSESLFHVDKSRDLSVKRKIEKHREKVLRCDSLLQRNPFVKPIPSSTLKKSNRKLKEALKAKLESQKLKEALEAKLESQNAPQVEQDSASGIVDIWDNKGEVSLPAKKKPKPSFTAIPAVEIEPPGCSFNPSFEAHQDSLALAVAAEMQKVYRNELGPQPVPLTVTGEAVDEEEMYFLDADDGSDGGPDEENKEIDDDTATEQRSSKTKRVTRVEQNRRARRKDHLKAEAEAKKVTKLSKEIDSVSDIMKEIAKEDEDKQKRHLRRVIVKQEKLKTGPPRLGKHKFEPAPVQVLLTEEISGSLRKLKGCSTLARDRFKSYEKRGILEPAAKRKRK